MMFNPEWETPLVMGSWQHLVALAVVITIILVVFLSRKFFMKHSLADKIFRYSLAIGLITFELILQLHSGPRPLFGKVLTDTYPLCGFMIWFCAIALFADSTRLMKLIYPLAITGGSLSLIVIDMTCTFPHFGAFQFWFVHGGFMLGALYFVFTKKINKYTLKDLGRSCLFLFILSIYILLISSGKLMYDKNFHDPLFVLSPPGGMESIKNALGPIGYSVLYILSVVGILFFIYGITYLCTIKRKCEEKINNERQNKILDFLSNINPKIRYLVLIIVFGVGVYASVLYRSTGLSFLVIIDEVLFLSLFILVVINERTTLYSKRMGNKKNEIQELN